MNVKTNAKKNAEMIVKIHVKLEANVNMNVKKNVKTIVKIYGQVELNVNICQDKRKDGTHL